MPPLTPSSCPLVAGLAHRTIARPVAGPGPRAHGAAGRRSAGSTCLAPPVPAPRRRAVPGAGLPLVPRSAGAGVRATGPGSRCEPQGRARSCSPDPVAGRGLGHRRPRRRPAHQLRAAAPGARASRREGGRRHGHRQRGWRAPLRGPDRRELRRSGPVARPARPPRAAAPEPDRPGSPPTRGALWGRPRVGTRLGRGSGSVSDRCPESLASSVARASSGLDHDALGPSLRSPARIRPAGAGPGAGNRSEGGPPHGRRHDATAARSRCALRAPDPPVEPEDAALHLR